MGKTWITPVVKQCFVVTGVSLNLASHGMVVGFATFLLPTLKAKGSPIPIDDEEGSWIASIIGFALLAGNFVTPAIMAKYGRRTANIIAITIMTIGWLLIVNASSVTEILVARIFQGFSMGMSSTFSPVLIGEYTSPKNRGAFLMTMSLAVAVGCLAVHAMGVYLSWRMTALAVACLTFSYLIIAFYSPESPSWLADQGRFEDSKRAFKWLRGDKEDDELHKMIKTIVNKEVKYTEIDIEKNILNKFKRKLSFFYATIQKPQFYKPILIMIHLYTLNQWSGINAIVIYTSDIFRSLGDVKNISLLVISLDLQRIFSSALGVFVAKKLTRRVFLFTVVSMNVLSLLTLSVYSYLRQSGSLPFEHPFIGIFLVHLQMFSQTTGISTSLAGELFPLEFRSLAGGISILFLSANVFVNTKTFPNLYNTIGLHGVYWIYLAIFLYCSVVLYFSLPETKGRTLQDIEDEFRGRVLSPEELKSTQSLRSIKSHSHDRKFSAPVI